MAIKGILVLFFSILSLAICAAAPAEAQQYARPPCAMIQDGTLLRTDSAHCYDVHGDPFANVRIMHGPNGAVAIAEMAHSRRPLAYGPSRPVVMMEQPQLRRAPCSGAPNRRAYEECMHYRERSELAQLGGRAVGVLVERAIRGY
jgi:hypothetical protein